MTKAQSPKIRSTTVLLVRRDGKVALAGDGQVTVGETVMKASAKKVRRLYNDKILISEDGTLAHSITGNFPHALIPKRKRSLEEILKDLTRHVEIFSRCSRHQANLR